MERVKDCSRRHTTPRADRGAEEESPPPKIIRRWRHQWQLRRRENVPPRPDRSPRSLNDDMAQQSRVRRVVVIVIPAGPAIGKTKRGLRLARLQQADVRDRRARRVRGMRIGFHVVRHGAVVRERHTLIDRNIHRGRTDRAIRANCDRCADRADRTG